MEQPDVLLKTAFGEIERLLSSKTVVGDPIQIGGNTIVPLFAVGFGFGGGGGAGEDQKATTAKGSGSGAAGGGGIRPIALVVVDKDGVVRVESVKATASVVEKMGDAIARAVEAGRAARVPA